MKPLHEKKESLWRLVIAPTVWMGHFMLCYITAAVWCAKFAGGRDAPLGGVRMAIAIYTVLALAAIAYNGWDGLRRFRLNVGSGPSHTDTPEGRHRFMGFATLLLAGLSAIATVFVAIAALYFEDCR